MRRLTLALIALIIAPAIVMAEPQLIEDDATEQPCDNLESTEKPSCDTDSESIENPAPIPNDPVIVPPDIPAEGLPNQDKSPSSDESQIKPQNR